MDDTTDRTRRPFRIQEATGILSRTPATLDTLLRGLPDSWVNAHEGGETWSAFDVLGHLIHGERRDWMQRTRTILTQGEAQVFEPFDRAAQFAASAGRTFPDLLEEFARIRAANLRELESFHLTEADLDRVGRHPAFGAVTLRQLLATWIAHDLDHIVQISRVLARQYSDEVGPWRAYLRIINGTPI
jgi:hypothetical protein